MSPEAGKERFACAYPFLFIRILIFYSFAN